MSPPITPEQLAALPPEVRAVVEALINHYERRIARLEADLAAARKTPQNSSLPPSSQHPHAKPVPAKPKSKNKPGGQPGHTKFERALISTDQCHAVITLQPKACRRCETKLSGCDPQPLRHQVWELPPIEPIVTEYQQHRLTCPGCGAATCAALPVGVPTSQAGPRLVAFVALLMGCFKQSKRRVALFLEQVIQQPCSPGWVVKLQQQATTALTPAYDQLASQLPTQPILGIDESPTKQAQAKSWLWTFVASAFTVFTLRTTRSGMVLAELLTDAFDGVVNCDRAKMYGHQGRLQYCWAHLKRDFQALADHPDHQVKRLGRDLLRPTTELFRLWSRCRDGTITRRGFQRSMTPIRQQIDSLLLRGVYSGNDKLRGMCGPLYAERQRLWTFVDVEGVEPTNNAAERALRPAVIWRKLSFGTQSAAGSRFVETLLTVVETCRQQQRNVFEFLTVAVEAHFAHQPAPSLLPRV